MNYLHKHLKGIKDQNAQISKLQELSIKQPWINTLIERIGNVNDVNVPAAHKKLQTLFWQQFSQPQNAFHTHILDENGNYYPVDSNKQQVHDIIKSNWRSNLISKQITGLVKIEGPNFVIDINHDIPMESIQDKPFEVVGTLPSKNIDTGMGLERIAMIMQEKESLFETDLFSSIHKELSKKIKNSDAKYEKIILDHIKASTFMLSDGVFPPNEGRGYI